MIVIELRVASAGTGLVVAVTHCYPFVAVARALTDHFQFLVFWSPPHLYLAEKKTDLIYYLLMEISFLLWQKNEMMIFCT